MAEEGMAPAATDNTAGANEEQNKPLIDPAVPETEKPQEGGAPPEGGEEKPLIDPEQRDTVQEGAPESYDDFSMPEGFVLEGEERDTVHGLFRDLNLSQEKAQKLVDYFSKRVTDDKAKMLEDLASKRKAWRSEIRNRQDHVLEAANVNKALRRYIREPDEVALFKDTWLSDHPVFWKVLSRIGADIGEDTPPPKGSGDNGGDSAVKRFPVNL